MRLQSVGVEPELGLGELSTESSSSSKNPSSVESSSGSSLKFFRRARARACRCSARLGSARLVRPPSRSLFSHLTRLPPSRPARRRLRLAPSLSPSPSPPPPRSLLAVADSQPPSFSQPPSLLPRLSPPPFFKERVVLVLVIILMMLARRIRIVIEYVVVQAIHTTFAKFDIEKGD